MGGIFLLTSIPLSCQGMDIAYSLISTVAAPVASFGASYIPESVKNTVSGYANTIYGEPKDFDNLFNEFTCNRKNTLLKDLVVKYKKGFESKALDISNPRRGVIGFNFNVNEVIESAEILRTYLLKYSLSLLTLDYTDECKTLIEQTIEEIEGIKIKYSEWESLGDTLENQKKEDTKFILEYMNKIKLNLGAALYAKYGYTRKGGFFDRGTRHLDVRRDRISYWKVSDLPPLDLSSPSANINTIINGKSQIALCIGKTIEIYNETFKFLTKKTEEILMHDDPYRNIENYKIQFRNLFNKEPSEDNLSSDLVNAYNVVRDDIINQNRGGLVTRMIPTPSVPIPRQNSAKLKKANSQSFGASSSLPVDFKAAVDAHKGVSSPSKAQSPLQHSPAAIAMDPLETKLILPPSIPKEGFANIVESYDPSKYSEYSGENSDSYTSSEETHSSDSND